MGAASAHQIVYRDDLPAHRRSPIQVLTGQSWMKLSPISDRFWTQHYQHRGNTIDCG